MAQSDVVLARARPRGVSGPLQTSRHLYWCTSTRVYTNYHEMLKSVMRRTAAAVIGLLVVAYEVHGEILGKAVLAGVNYESSLRRGP